MRGKRGLADSIGTRIGLIPAHAGKTPSFPGKPWQPRAHPRACGENASQDNCNGSLAGSSPRMRGKQISLGKRHVPRGLIPAHAGKTPRASNPAWPPAAHPRACGENNRQPALNRPRLGSSPRMRGKPPGCVQHRCERRLIPAHAGKTAAQMVQAIKSGAHPRACGENRAWLAWPGIGPGSSPRMRGKQLRVFNC